MKKDTTIHNVVLGGIGVAMFAWVIIIGEAFIRLNEEGKERRESNS